MQCSQYFYYFTFKYAIGVESFYLKNLNNGALSIGTQNSLYSLVSKEQIGIFSGLLQTSRFIGNILASSLYGVMFASGVNDANKNSISVVLLIVSLLIIPIVLYITKKDKGI